MCGAGCGQLGIQNVGLGARPSARSRGRAFGAYQGTKLPKPYKGKMQNFRFLQSLRKKTTSLGILHEFLKLQSCTLAGMEVVAIEQVCSLSRVAMASQGQCMVNGPWPWDVYTRLWQWPSLTGYNSYTQYDTLQLTSWRRRRHYISTNIGNSDGDWRITWQTSVNLAVVIPVADNAVGHEVIHVRYWQQHRMSVDCRGVRRRPTATVSVSWTCRCRDHVGR